MTTTPTLRVVIQPDEGVKPVIDLISSAKTSLRIKQFTFSEANIVEAVLAAQKRGVNVRIMLNPHRSSGDRANDDTFEKFKAAGIAIEWTSPKFAVTHEKSIVVDDRVALIATFNLCLKYFTETRDYGIITTDPAQVAEIVSCFEADWKRENFQADPSIGLLWSNSNSRLLMAEFIDQAKHRLEIQHPKYVDAVILDRVVQAAKRGVHVKILCGGKHGISDWDVLDTFSSLRLMKTMDAKVHRMKHLKLHAKLIIVDEKYALVGSMNIDRSAFDLRRELGIVTEQPDVVSSLREVFRSDWDLSHHYDIPDPLKEHPNPEEEIPHDPHFNHE